MMKRAMLGRAFTPAMLLACSACAFGVGAGGEVSADRSLVRPVQLQVTNQSGGPLEIFATGSGTSYRVGTVHPGLTGRFVLRPGVTAQGAVEFTARSADGRSVQSGPMLLRSGEIVDFALTPYAATSAATVRTWVSR